jgi:hypothetical protein
MQMVRFVQKTVVVSSQLIALQNNQQRVGKVLVWRLRLKANVFPALWEEGQEEAWFIITDLSPSASSACWYGMRAWIEQSFRIAKRGNGIEYE